MSDAAYICTGDKDLPPQTVQALQEIVKALSEISLPPQPGEEAQ